MAVKAPAVVESPVAATRLMAGVGIVGVLVAATLVGALHVLPDTSGISPVRRTVSEYALTDTAWAFNVGTVALAVGSLAIVVAAIRSGRARSGSLGAMLGVTWSLALLVVVAFPKHDWAIGPSASGHVHRVASIVAFLCLPVAVMLLTRRPASGPAARSAFWLGALSLAWFAPLFGAWLLSPVTGLPWYRAVPLGLVERGLLLCEVAAVVAVGVWVLTATGRTPILPMGVSPPSRQHAAPAS